MEYLDQVQGEDKLKLIDALREVTEGKVRAVVNGLVSGGELEQRTDLP